MRGPPSHVNASIWLEVSGWDPPPPYPAVGPLHITAITSSTLQRRRYGHGQDGRRASVSSWRNSSSTHSKGEWLTKSGQTTGQGAVSKESPPFPHIKGWPCHLGPTDDGQLCHHVAQRLMSIFVLSPLQSEHRYFHKKDRCANSAVAITEV